MKKSFYTSIVFVSFFSLSAWSLEKYQGKDYPVESWRCGAPLVEELRKNDPDNLLNDPTGKLNLKESLEEISEQNLNRLKSKLGKLTSKELALVDLIRTKFQPPIVHRTSVETSKFIVTTEAGMVSATKRKSPPKGTPMIEQNLFSGHDCLFTSVATPYGIEDYGTVIFRFRDRKGFAWGSMYTGYRFALEVENKTPTADAATPGMKRRFAKQIFTNNHWEEAIALFIIENVRAGTTFRGKGAAYDKATILDQLLSIPSPGRFWTKVVAHRLAFLEGHYVDNVPVGDLSFVQYRTSDRPVIESWNLPAEWLRDENSFIQFFNRTK